MSKTYDAIVIGGGAAGMMCAWQAGLRGKRVVVLERSKKIGRKILMSGGGRCNFTNLYVEPDNFICANPHFVKSALSQYTAWDFIGSVIEHDIAYHERSHGQLFCDDKAKAIVNMLVSECSKVSVETVMQCDIEELNCVDDEGYILNTNQGKYKAKAVVVATGGLSIPHMDPTPFGYEIARQFGLNVLPICASLVPYTFSGALKDMFGRLSGNAIPTRISVGKREFVEAMLFTHRGLSGPVVLQISNYWQPSDAISIDLLPDILTQSLPKNVVLEFEQLWWPELKDRPLVDWPDAQIKTVGQQFNHWQIVPSGTEGYRTAEVTLGGVDTDELSSKTMEAKSQPGLYFIGEVVDVTGHLGGFNFQWAWSSAYACAQALLR